MAHHCAGAPTTVRRTCPSTRGHSSPRRRRNPHAPSAARPAWPTQAQAPRHPASGALPRWPSAALPASACWSHHQPCAGARAAPEPAARALVRASAWQAPPTCVDSARAPSPPAPAQAVPRIAATHAASTLRSRQTRIHLPAACAWPAPQPRVPSRTTAPPVDHAPPPPAPAPQRAALRSRAQAEWPAMPSSRPPRSRCAPTTPPRR